MADNFNPPPIRSTIGLNNGQIANIWAQWFQTLYSKVGGNNAPSITQINNIVVANSAELSAAQNAIADLQVESAFEQDRGVLLRSKINEINVNDAFNVSHRITQTTNVYDY